jgi:ribosomal protein L15
VRLNRGGLKRFGQAVKAGRGRCGGGSRVGHIGIKNGTEVMPLCEQVGSLDFIRRERASQSLQN